MRSTAQTLTESKRDSVVDLAQCLAGAVPAVPAGLRDDDWGNRVWADLMLEAAHGLAAAVGHDDAVLRRALGPTVEVGVIPPWRALLEIAHLVSTPDSEFATGVISRSLAHA